MIVRNNCIQDDSISVEVNGYCSTISQIINQSPQIDYEELMVYIGPHLVSLNELVMNVYDFIQIYQSKNDNNFNQLFNQYNLLYNFFMKCCADLIGRLNRIEKRVNDMVFVRQIVIEKPITQPIRKTPIRQAQLISIQKPPVVIDEEIYVIDQAITSGYIDGYKRYNHFGSYSFDEYVFWLKSNDGFTRKLLPKQVPYKKGTPQANTFVEKIKSVFIENNIEFNTSILRIKYS